MRVGGSGKSQVGKGEEGTTLGTPSGIEVFRRDGKPGFAIPGFDFQQFHAGARGEKVFLEKFLWRHHKVYVFGFADKNSN